MTDENGVSAIEAGMLAANRNEIIEKVDEKKSTPEPPPVAPVLKKKTPPLQSAAAKNTVSEPLAPPESTGEADSPDSGLIAKLMRMVPYAHYAVIGLLVVGQIVFIIKLSSNGHKLSELEKTLIELKADFAKREAEQDKKFTEALSEKDRNDIESRKRSIATETLNKLRDGLPERKLIRKKGGDWYVMGNREEAVGSPEVIEILNNAYASAKSAERTGQIVPPHTGNAICVLKPDGKGGTIVKTAYDYIVGGK